MNKNTERIAKNTLFLYVRMLLTMGVSLYTSRVVLNVLGVSDYGTYSVVGGVVMMFSFLNAAMASGTQRFLSFDIGKKDDVKLNKTFNATLSIHIAIAILILIVAETIGLWFVNFKLNVSEERLSAVNYVYQFSILSLLVGVVRVPYNALIMARERMNIYAILGFLEVLLKLLIVYILVIFSFDKLILYAILTFITSFLITYAYIYYCNKKFRESFYKFYYNKKDYSHILSFSGWNLVGNIAKLTKEQGVNIMLNLVFGTIVNAAYGITLSVQSAVYGFVINFQAAVNPQIIMSYAANDYEQSQKLIFQSSKLSYFLMFIIVICLIFNMDFVLKVWLDNPPKYTAIFTTLCLINLLIDTLSGPLMTGIQAAGEMKWYQIVVGGLILLNLPLSYFLLKLYDEPQLIYEVSIFISIIALFLRMFFLKKHFPFSIQDFFKKVILRAILVSAITVIIYLIIDRSLVSLNSWPLFFVRLLLLLVISISSIIVFGMSESEKTFIRKLILKKVKSEKK